MAQELSKTEIKIFCRWKKTLFFFSFDSLKSQVKSFTFWPNVWEHMEAGSLFADESPPAHTFLTNVWCSAPLTSKHFFLTLRWTAFVNYTVPSNVDASTRLQTRCSSCQILSSNWICAGMLIYYGMFPWNINSDLGNRFRLFSGDKLQTFFIYWD